MDDLIDVFGYFYAYDIDGIPIVYITIYGDFICADCADDSADVIDATVRSIFMCEYCGRIIV
jgi:hypothetical protein